MPCSIPVWKNNLEAVSLDSLFGFIEAYVVCPSTISRPFLPYKDQSGTLIFPTGKFIGVFYSEELKFARVSSCSFSRVFPETSKQESLPVPFDHIPVTSGA